MSYSDTNNSALDTSAGFADISYTADANATLSPLAANDIEAQTDYVQVDEDSGDEETIEERFVQEDGTVVIKVKKIKKIKKAAKKVTKNANELADATVKLVAVAVDNMQDSSNELPEGVITTGKWDARLLSCFDFCVPNCLMATFCPCVTVAQVASRIGFSYKNVLLAFGALIAIEYIFWVIAMATVRTTESVDGYYYSSLYGGYIDYTYSIQTSRWPVWGYISSLATIAMFIGVWQLRTKVRERFQLPGSACEDCLISFFCSCCSIAQLATHVKSYKQGSCDFGPPDELRAYEH